METPRKSCLFSAFDHLLYYYNEWKRSTDLKSKTDLPFELTKDTHFTKPFVYIDAILKDYLSIYAYEDIGEQKDFTGV